MKRALSYGAYSTLVPRADAGTLGAAAQTKNESAADVAAIFATEFKRLANEPLDAETVTQRVAYLQGVTSRGTETSAGFAGTLASLVMQGVDPKEAAGLRNRIGTVTPQAAVAAARRTIGNGAVTVVIVGDAKMFADKVRTQYPAAEIIPLNALDLDRPTLTAR